MEKPNEITIRPGAPGDTDRILGLVRCSLGEGSIPRTTEYWTWKHFENPFGTSPILLAEANGQLVGLRVFLRWKWEAQGRQITAVRAVDTATHPDWQGRGIFSRLTLALVEQMRQEDVSFVFNTPNEQSRPGYLKMGWSSVGRSSLWIRPHRPWRLIQRLSPRAEMKPEAWQTMGQEEHSARKFLEQSEIDWIIEPRRDHRLSTRRSREYLKWRYGRVPGFAYHAYGLRRNGGEALVIFRTMLRRELKELRLCEILLGAGRNSKRIAKEVVRDILAVTAPDYAVAMAASRTEERWVLSRAGFVPVPRSGPILTARPLTCYGTDIDPRQRSAWRLSIGDLELF